MTANLANGQFLTKLNGRQCTAVPKQGSGGGGGGGSSSSSTKASSRAAATSATSAISTDSTTTSAAPPPAPTSTSPKTTAVNATKVSPTVSTKLPGPTDDSSEAGAAAVVSAPPAPTDTASEAVATASPVPAATSTLAASFASPDSPPPQSTAVSGQSAASVTVVPSNLAEPTPTATFTTPATPTTPPDTPATAAATNETTQKGPALPAPVAPTTTETTASSTGLAAAGGAAAGATRLSAGDGAELTSTIFAPPAVSSVATAAGSEGTSGSSNNHGIVAGTTATAEGSPGTTVAIVGGVIGGLAFASLLALLVWFWRRRVRKRRRSTLLTPLSVPEGENGEATDSGGSGRGSPATGDNASSTYSINRGSIGSGPRVERLKASAHYTLQRIRGRMADFVRDIRGVSGRSGTAPAKTDNSTRSKGGGEDGSRGVGGSLAAAVAATGAAAAGLGDRMKRGLFGGMAALSSGWRELSGQEERRNMYSSSNAADGGNESEKQQNQDTTMPDAVTRLGMGERELARAAQNKKTSRKKRRESIDRRDHSRNMSISSTENKKKNYLGHLTLDFSDSSSGSRSGPFGNAYAVGASVVVTKPAPLVVSQSNNPFSDDYAAAGEGQGNKANGAISNSNGSSDGGPYLLKAATYVPPVSTAVAATTVTAPSDRQPSARDSVATVATVATTTTVTAAEAARRNRFRSDPFDLERPGRLLQARAAMAAAAVIAAAGGSGGGDRRPLPTETTPAGLPPPPTQTARQQQQQQDRRSDSFQSSKYSSGVASLGEWSDPGPDVGPAGARRGEEAEKDERENEILPGERPRRRQDDEDDDNPFRDPQQKQLQQQLSQQRRGGVGQAL